MMSDPDGGTGCSEPRRVLFVTGRLAELALRRVIDKMAPPFEYDIVVLGITVAALMTTSWIARHLHVPRGVDLLLIPGLCEGDLQIIVDTFGVRVERGPKDLRQLPTHFGRTAVEHYGAWDIEIVAEINNVPRLTREAIRREAAYLCHSGADVVDLGCTPGLAFPALADVVRDLTGSGMRVSVDTFNPDEIRTAVSAGAELVLSVNGSNIDVARELSATNTRVVVVPDQGGDLDTLEPTVTKLARWDVHFLIDPILEPVSCGFMASLERYAEVRRRYPDAEMLMGIGNVTELTAADSTGVNAILIAICQELGVRTVLTTEVIPWARGVVREVDVARRLMHYAVTQHTPPKGVDNRLLTVKDAEQLAFSDAELQTLQANITDSNFRIFADPDGITVLNDKRFVRGTDIQDIFNQLEVDETMHAFYLGKELARASLAVTLGKTYRQEGALAWGYLTPPDDPTSAHVPLTQRPARARHHATADNTGADRRPRNADSDTPTDPSADGNSD